MSGEVENGECSVCGAIGNVDRTYFRYTIKCDCCNRVR